MKSRDKRISALVGANYKSNPHAVWVHETTRGGMRGYRPVRQANYRPTYRQSARRKQPSLVVELVRVVAFIACAWLAYGLLASVT